MSRVWWCEVIGSLDYRTEGLDFWASALSFTLFSRFSLTRHVFARNASFHLTRFMVRYESESEREQQAEWRRRAGAPRRAPRKSMLASCSGPEGAVRE